MRSAYLFDEFCKQCEQEALKDGRKGAASNYRKTRQKLATYNPDGSLSLSDINGKWVKSFNDWLVAQNHEKTTISFYNRALRSLYNQAVEKQFVKDTHPFDEVYTKTIIAHYPISFEGDERIPFETISRDDLLKRYKALAYKYNTILRQLKGIVQA